LSPGRVSLGSIICLERRLAKLNATTPYQFAHIAMSSSTNGYFIGTARPIKASVAHRYGIIINVTSSGGGSSGSNSLFWLL
jgi:hypothetical protein